MLTQLVHEGGPSAPAWAFFTAISLGILTLIGQQLSARKRIDEAADNADIAVHNTSNVSNGFVARVDDKLNRIMATQDDMSKALRDHLEWHLETGGNVPPHSHGKGKS